MRAGSGAKSYRNVRLIATMFIAQLICMVLLVCVALYFSLGKQAAISLATGVLVNMISQIYASLRMLTMHKHSSEKMLKSFLKIEVIKFLVAGVLLAYLITSVAWVLPLWVVIGFVMAQMVATMSPAFVKNIYS